MPTPPEKEAAFNRLCTLWMRTMNRMHEIEAIPIDFGTGQLLHPSEIHTIQAIGLRLEMNVTALAAAMGVSRGAASQMVGRLAGKGLIEKYRRPGNDKEVCLRLTPAGTTAFEGHEVRDGWIRRRFSERLGDMDAEAYALLLAVFEEIDEAVAEMQGEQRHTAEGDEA
jgi:DNA-binding MarR family transcriptional regulator